MAYSTLIVKIFIIFQFNSLLSAQVVTVVPPEQQVAPLGGSAQFTCSSFGDTIESIQWLLDGTVVDNSSLQINTIFNTQFGVGLLEFSDLSLDLNSSRIQCIAAFDSGRVTSSVTLLLLQGLLPAVGNLTLIMDDSIVSISWTPPFSLDIPGNSDIDGYCVATYRSNSLVNSECNIEETRYSYTLPPDSGCYIYNFTVTPVNVVGLGQMNATTTYSPNQATVQAVTTGDGLSYTITMSAGVCIAELTFVDFDTRDIPLSNTDLTIVDEDITFTTEQLTDNHRYNVTVNASNAAGSSLSHVTISTHDIVNSTTTKNSLNEVEVTAFYSEHSDARGALFDFVFIDDNGDVDFTRSVLLALDRNTSLHHTLPFNLYPGQYRVFVYDIESDGTLSNGVGYPAITDQLITSGSGPDISIRSNLNHISSCQITTSSRISAECKFRSGTMATGFQMIAQFSNSDRVHKLHINQSMDLQTPVTVEVEESGMYLVTIISITEEAGIVGSGVEYTKVVMVGITHTTFSTGAVVGIVIALIIFMMVIMIIFFLWKCCKKPAPKVLDKAVNMLIDKIIESTEKLRSMEKLIDESLKAMSTKELIEGLIQNTDQIRHDKDEKVDLLVKHLIAYRQQKEIGIPLGSSQKELDQNYIEDKLLKILSNDSLDSSTKKEFLKKEIVSLSTTEV